MIAIDRQPTDFARNRRSESPQSNQAANLPVYSQLTPRSVGLSHNSPGLSNPDITAYSEQGRQSSAASLVPINTAQDSSKLWNIQSTLANDGDFCSTALDAQAPSVDNNSPPRHGTNCLETSLHMPNQKSTQAPDAKPPNPQRTSPANTTAGNHGADSLHAGNPDSSTGSETLHNSSLSAAMLATNLRDESQLRPHTRPSQRRNGSRWEDASNSPVDPNQRQPLEYGGNTGKSVPQALESRLRPGGANIHALDGFPQSPYQSPAITFAIDNQIESDLSMAEMQSLIETFSKSGQVLARPKKSPTRYKVYPVGVIIWQSSADFYKWYLIETGTSQIAILKFELFDASGRFEKALFVPGGDLYYFQMLKQYIWDSFWVTSKLNGATASFKVLVTAAPRMGSEAFPPTSVGPWGNGITTAFPTEYPTTKLGNVGAVVDSQLPRGDDRSTPHYSRQMPFAAPARITNSVTVPQMDIQPAYMYTSFAVRQPERPKSFMEHQPGGATHLCDLSSRRTAIAPLPAPEIVVRLQTDGMGKLSCTYDKSVLRPKITAMDFFAWFASQTGRGGDIGPPSLTFTFKDAIPIPRSRTITRTNEDYFDLIRDDIKVQFGKAWKDMQNLKEFTILVTDPEWFLEEDW